MTDFVSPDGSFGFGGLQTKDMMVLMVPLIQECKPLEDADEIIGQIHDIMALVKPNSDDDMSPDVDANVICAIIAHKKYGLDLTLAAQMAAKQEAVQWCFTKYMEQTGGKLDAAFTAETVIKVGEGDAGITVSASEMSDEAKFMQLMPAISEVASGIHRNEKLRYAAGKLLNKLKPYGRGIDVVKQHMLAMLLHARYKRDLNECFELAKDGKALQPCFEEFMKEMGTEIMSDVMGEPPSSTAH